MFVFLLFFDLESDGILGEIVLQGDDSSGRWTINMFYHLLSPPSEVCLPWLPWGWPLKPPKVFLCLKCLYDYTGTGYRVDDIRLGRSIPHVCHSIIPPNLSNAHGSEWGQLETMSWAVRLAFLEPHAQVSIRAFHWVTGY